MNLVDAHRIGSPRSNQVITNAEMIARSLGGHRAGVSWMAPCPAHEDRTPSLALRDSNATVLVRCHAGCEQDVVLSALRARGLWPGHAQGAFPQASSMPCETVGRTGDNFARRTDHALQIWERASVAKGTIVAAYLAHRGINLRIPDTIRFHPALKHQSGAVGPAMVAFVTDGRDDRPVGIHRTFLQPDGKGKSSLEPAKMMLGPCRGGAVRLSPFGRRLLIGEGIETCLSAMKVVGGAAWAALSTSGLCTLELPDVVEDIVVLADGDVAGEHAAREAAKRWTNQGRRVRIARPPWGFDFNDVLLGKPAQNKQVP